MSVHAPGPRSVILPVRPAWLDRWQEEILDPGLPIVDPHHHLWDSPAGRYLFDDLLADLRCGHTVVATVFVQCTSMYRADGPQALRPIGETEFVNGVAAMSASGGYGPTRICAGIVGHADLRLGARVQAVLEAHIRAGGDRFRGIRQVTAQDASVPYFSARSGRSPIPVLAPVTIRGNVHRDRVIMPPGDRRGASRPAPGWPRLVLPGGRVARVPGGRGWLVRGPGGAAPR